jgi:hypothetical protein
MQVEICFTIVGDYISLTTSFDLWMSYGTHDVFALIIIFFKND